MQTCRKCQRVFEVATDIDPVSALYCDSCRADERRRILLTGSITSEEEGLIRVLSERSFTGEQWNALPAFERAMIDGWWRAHHRTVPDRVASEHRKAVMREKMKGNQNARGKRSLEAKQHMRDGQFRRYGKEKANGTAEG
jgi:hypothetical protein